MQRFSLTTDTPLRSLIVLSAVLGIAFVAYAPGLHGGFLFDDFINLPSLGAQGPIDNWPAFWRYISSGTADPTGRPLTLLTFLLDARDWPASPYPFKRTSLVLHLINGVLLYALLCRLGAILHGGPSETTRRSARIGASLWLLHPLFVSTTLYIVQREAMLPATCVLAGLLTWLHARELIVTGKYLQGSIVTATAITSFTVLGTLAKANGALLPLFVLLIEYALLRRQRPIPTVPALLVYRTTLFICGVLPAAAIASYLLWTGVHGMAMGDVPSRSWTYGQRLLTEPRVLMDYLGLLWIPRAESSGLFNDHYAPSTSLIHPATTLLAILALAMLAGVAWLCRKRATALSMAIGFFFVGHLIESTSIPLELYFEHRNYLPAMLLFWPLGVWLADRGTLGTLKTTLTWATMLLLALLTHSRAQLWGNELSQALVWARISPDSPRAQANAAQAEMQAGRPDLAVDRLQHWLSNRPNDLQISFNLLGAQCMMGAASAPAMEAARQAILTTPSAGALLAHWLDRMLPVATSGQCKNLTTSSLLTLIDAGLSNQRLSDPSSKQDLTYLRGRIQLAQQQPDAALADFERAIDWVAQPGVALEGAALLGSAGYPSHGRQLLEHYSWAETQTARPGLGMPMVHEYILRQQNYWPRELAHIQRQLDADIKQANSTSPRE